MLFLLPSCDDDSSGPSGSDSLVPYSKKLKKITFASTGYNSVEYFYNNDKSFIDSIVVDFDGAGIDVHKILTPELIGNDTLWTDMSIHDLIQGKDTTYYYMKVSWVGNTKKILHFETSELDPQNNEYSFTYDEQGMLSQFIINKPLWRRIEVSIDQLDGMTNIEYDWKDEGSESEITTMEAEAIEKLNPLSQIDFLGEEYFMGNSAIAFNTRLMNKISYSTVVDGQNEVATLQYTYEYDESGHPTKIIETNSNAEIIQETILEWE